MYKTVRLIFTTAFILFSLGSPAQFSTVWNTPYQHTTTPSYSNEGRKVAEDPTGNIFVLADVTSDLDPAGLPGTQTYHYVTLTKYSTNGAVLNTLNIQVYNHVANGYDNPGAFGLKVDASGNVYVGYSTFDAVNGYDVALGKYDNNLSRIWSNLYSTPANESGIDMELDASGTLYAAVKSSDLQTTYSIISSIPFSGPSTLVYSFPANTVAVNAIALDGAQIVYVGGSAMKGGYKNAYVAAIDISSHSISWGSLYSPKGIVGDDVVNEITVGADGNIYSVGTSYQGIDFGDLVLVLKNIPGNPRFDFAVLLKGNSYDTEGKFINASESGWLYLAGESEHENYAYVFRIPDDGIFISPSKIQFTPVPQTVYDTVFSISVTDMKVTANKNVYLTGSIAAQSASGNFSCSFLNKSSVVFGNALVDAGAMPVEGQYNSNLEGVALSLDYGKTDIYWLRNNWDNLHQAETVELLDVDVPAPFKEAKPQVNNSLISMSPNPATTHVTLRSSQIISSIVVTDMMGREMLFLEPLADEATLELYSLQSGNYILRIKTEGLEQRKLLVIN